MVTFNPFRDGFLVRISGKSEIDSISNKVYLCGKFFLRKKSSKKDFEKEYEMFFPIKP
jgi:hypothetical protein